VGLKKSAAAVDLTDDDAVLLSSLTRQRSTLTTSLNKKTQIKKQFDTHLSLFNYKIHTHVQAAPKKLSKGYILFTE